MLIGALSSALELDQILRNDRVSDRTKAQTQRNLKRGEMEFLRFRRTKESPSNYATVKIIGKGAFGEVKLVQKKTDGKIYALKSLVKAEMVGTGNARLYLQVCSR